MTDSGSSAGKWIPLESNPDVLTKYMHKIGMSKDWKFSDVFGLDPDLLAMLNQPVIALVVLFRITDKVVKSDTERLAKIEKDGQSVSPNLYFMKQTISNACGTIGLLHSVINVQDEVPLENPLKEFAEKSKSMTPDERAAFLKEDKTLTVAHEESAQEGQTEAPSAEDSVDHHFIALVHKDGSLYEMDGRKPFPINHGPATKETFLTNAAKVCKEFMERDPDELRFNIVALVPAN